MLNNNSNDNLKKDNLNNADIRLSEEEKLVGVERNKQLRARKIHIRNAYRYLIPILSLCQIAIFCIPKVYNINVSVSVNPSESSVATSSMFLLSNISKRIPK